MKKRKKSTTSTKTKMVFVKFVPTSGELPNQCKNCAFLKKLKCTLPKGNFC